MPFITGMGWVTVGGMGCGRESKCFDMTPGSVPPVSRKAVTDKPFSHFGRMDEFSKLGLAGIAFALRDAGLHEWTEKRPIGIVASTVYGCLQTDMDYYDTVIQGDGGQGSPILFSYTLPNCFLGEAAGHYGTTGLSYVIHDPCFAGLSSLSALLLNMRLNEFEKGLAGIVDGNCPPDFPSTAKIPPGAAFIMIEQTPHFEQRPYYGVVELTEEGEVLLNDKKPATLVNLMQECLNAFHG